MKIFFGILAIVVITAIGTFFFLKFNTPFTGKQSLEPAIAPENNSSSKPSAETATLPENAKTSTIPALKEKVISATSTPNTFFTLLEGDSVFLAKDDGSFAYSGDVNPSAVTKKFFDYYPDNHDFIIIFTTYSNTVGADYVYVVNNIIKGLGDITFIDQSKIYGSKGLLKAIPVLHNIPTNKKFSDLVHELSHYWLMYIQNTPSFPINRDGAHWSNWLDTAVREGGYLYYDANGGLAYKDNGNGTFSQDPTPLGGEYSFHKFSSMSLYLMGLMPASEVQPLTLWQTSSADGISIMTGTKKTVTVDDIIKIAGRRIPAYPDAQRNFKVAYILLPKRGVTATNAQIESIKWIAENFPAEWNSATHGRSTISPVK